MSISDSALITAASRTGQARTGDALLNMDSGPGRNAITGLAGGTIKLKAQNKAVVSGSAQITAASETGTGGRIEITGDKVGLLGQARLDASGAAGGGGILVGGDYQGKNPAVRNARITYIGKNARLSADAKTKGKGGRDHRLGGRHHALSRADFGPAAAHRAALAALWRSRASVIWRFGARWM